MQKRRVFSFSNRNCPAEPCGGSGGVNYKLLFANREYRYIDEMYNIFKDVIIDNDSMLTVELVGMRGKSYEEITQKKYLKLHSYYNFSNDDVYIFHDVESALIFMSLFNASKTVLVYHQQGSLYRENVAFGGVEDENKKKHLDNLLKEAISRINYLGFPSVGAKQGLIDSEPSLENLVNKSNIKILYNGFKNSGNIEPLGEEAKQVIEKIKNFSEFKFITVAVLNSVKGVERIPRFLSEIKKKYGEFKWIIVGDGIKKSELQANIDKYNIEENVIWIKNKIPHDDILALFRYTDFYILTHRISIFDFATIEAMSYGNIPILTPVGGNKEVIIDNNGIFLNDLTNIADFSELISNGLIEQTKLKNIRIAESMFNEREFLKRYAELVNEI
ncbi:glycosyltransferase [Clostridium sp. BL-8]|uniref:glycosyltransferase n=1 Tax=Clostridium sp. BL-8 TaxID=349938 RepID=UPI00098C59B8|nr:glycosyltransferase [Clostridium sp. BL-8]OOM79914.1 UDP-D-galactose:(glucosyl)lipopolysaccharide-1,6-D-galactosyltransferase [Clostridium sp. BL-8]